MAATSQQKPGHGEHIAMPSLMTIIRLLDWAVESNEGHDSPCWIWQGHCDSDGYAEVKFRGRKFRAVRVAYAAFHGGLAGGLDVDHICRVRNCINPTHLEAVDPIINRVVRRDERRQAARVRRIAHEVSGGRVNID